MIPKLARELRPDDVLDNGRVVTRNEAVSAQRRLVHTADPESGEIETERLPMDEMLWVKERSEVAA